MELGVWRGGWLEGRTAVCEQELRVEEVGVLVQGSGVSFQGRVFRVEGRVLSFEF